MKTETAKVGARGVDSYPYSLGGTPEQAKAMKSAGVDFLIGYIGFITPERLKGILDAGLAFMPVTVAGEFFDGADDEIAQLKALNLPKNCTIWLDLEGDKAYKTPPATLIKLINEWAGKIIAAGYQPGLYVASPQPLTGDELYALKVVRYWKAPARIIDRNGKVWDGPSCGFCCYQLWPSVMWAGVYVDVDFIQQDYQGRLPSWVVA